MVSVVWRLVRPIWVAAGRVCTSTRLNSGTLRPSLVRTLKLSRSSGVVCSAPAKRTHTGTSVSPRRNSRNEAPRSARPTKLATCSALKPNADARSRSTRTASSVLRSPVSTRTSRNSLRRASSGTTSSAIARRVWVESPTSCTCTLCAPLPCPLPLPLPLPLLPTL